MEQCRESARLRLTGHYLFQADAPGNRIERQCITCARMGQSHSTTPLGEMRREMPFFRIAISKTKSQVRDLRVRAVQDLPL